MKSINQSCLAEIFDNIIFRKKDNTSQIKGKIQKITFWVQKRSNSLHHWSNNPTFLFNISNYSI